ncbi:choice-of-anchor L domain-containing protein [Thiohalorhabdus methylotrophus]|uniref:Choice-of-anchor L domain-containing protein n=1 Tax=Thiohalorhabdus methylotrophus TaxID=3242694 RepID=A0ABV4TS47_9GAMM
MHRTGTALFLLLAGTGSAHAIAVSPTDDASTLVNNIIGPGITLQGAPTYTDGDDVTQSGTFTDGNSSGIGIDQGVVMTTGSAADVDNTNTSDATSTDTNAAGDPDLDNLVAPEETQDAAVLEFDFTTDSGNLAFNYVFASEEYNEYVNQEFNDVFGFFLDGQNIALLPGTSTPVSINNVNGGNPLGTNASNAQLYNNNDLDDGGPNFDFEYDGFTDVLTAQGTNLGTGTHSIKLAIADTADGLFDSGVFIESGSFTGDPGPGPEPVPAPGTALLLGLGMAGLGWAGRRSTRTD